MINLTTSPFNLDQKSIQWVEETVRQMTLEEKIGQLFCTIGFSNDKKELDY